MKCASLQVPLDYANPGGRKISIALTMIPATAPKAQQQGIMLVNPGGPGAPGRGLALTIAQSIDPSVAAEYDIVGFDPRGVGGSDPALSCDPSFFVGARPDYDPTSPAEEQQSISRAREYAAGCGQRFGWLLPHMTTQDAARDMDSIRAAFGVSKITYYAFSYGTYLGQVYATLFPSRVRRMVLDSTVDPTGVWYADNIAQDYAFQGRVDAFFAWTAKNDGTYHLGSTGAAVAQAYSRVRAMLAASPVGISGHPQLGPDELDDTYTEGGYANWYWPQLAQALSQYSLSNGAQTSSLVTAYQSLGTQTENEFAVYNAVQCSDVDWPRTWAKWQADTQTVQKTAPFYAWGNAWFNAACAFWPVKGPAQPMQINGEGLPGILMLQGTLDAATPYAGAQDAHKLLPTARMVVVQGGGNHGQSLTSPVDSCVMSYLNDYLGTGALPPDRGLVDATCPTPPDPSPGGLHASVDSCCALGRGQSRHGCSMTVTVRRCSRSATRTRWQTCSSRPGSGRWALTRAGLAPRYGAVSRGGSSPRRVTPEPTWCPSRSARRRRSPRTPIARCGTGGAAHPWSGLLAW
jgi:pimeloyl-ACP methyl ester carboxylesterase